MAPIVNEKTQLRAYIESLSRYQLSVGELTSVSGVWPQPDKLVSFVRLCETAYQPSLALIDEANKTQAARREHLKGSE